MTNYRWIDLLGEFEHIEDDQVFLGREYDDPNASGNPTMQQAQPAGSTTETVSAVPKRVWTGLSVCDQYFKEGVIKVDIEFEQVDWRCSADIILQYDADTEDMLAFSIGGSATGANFFALRLWTAQQNDLKTNIATGTGGPTKAWRFLRSGGDRTNLKTGHSYKIVIQVRGLSINIAIDGVDVARHVLPFPLQGQQVGLFCAAPKKIWFRNFEVQTERPQAFVVMQFNTPEYESLFNDVITPICGKVGLRVYRADFTKLPGLVIEDIAKQLTESRVIIAEVTPVNGNVYYEVGYADALKKPVILVANKDVGQLPFDVRPYRTIFYENSIAGKHQVEASLEGYLRNILERRSF